MSHMLVFGAYWHQAKEERRTIMGKKVCRKTKVTTSKRATLMHARKCAQRKATAGGGAARVWEKDLT
jgi:hypothetical protein